VTIKAFSSEFQKLTGKTKLENELRQAWSRIQFTYDPLSYHSSGEANNVYGIGFLAKGKPDLSWIYDPEGEGIAANMRSSRCGRRTSRINSLISHDSNSLILYTISFSPSLPIILILQKPRSPEECCPSLLQTLRCLVL
jgi:hypothetical protein